MAQAFKIFFMILIAGVALFVWRSGVVQKFAVAIVPAGASSTASMSRIFPFFMGQPHE